MLFYLWMISGTVLGLLFALASRQPIGGMILGFLLAPILPIAIVYALIQTLMKQ